MDSITQIALGAAIGRLGEECRDEVLISVGGDLLQFAAEPNIMGVDRLLAKLVRVVKQDDLVKQQKAKRDAS